MYRFAIGQAVRTGTAQVALNAEGEVDVTVDHLDGTVIGMTYTPADVPLYIVSVPSQTPQGLLISFYSLFEDELAEVPKESRKESAQ